MSTLSLREQKRALRKQVLAERDKLPEIERTERSIRACEQLLEFTPLNQCQAVMAFYPFNSELDVRPFLETARQKGQQIWLPLSLPAERKLVPYVYTGVESLRRGVYGIFEPDPALSTPGDLSQLEAVILPGVAFDKSGGRLGYGGGYYDRFLSSLLRRPLLIGTGFSLQILNELPMEAHDYRLDFVITDDDLLGPFDEE